MVFESDLQTVKNDINTDQHSKGLVDLDSLITRVEAHYATLNPRQKEQWEYTRIELAHCREHLEECMNIRNVLQQKSRVQRILNRITVI